MRNETVVKMQRSADESQQRGTCPPMWLLDKIAEEKLSGGFDSRRSNVCGDCFTARSVNGTCAC